MRCSHTSPPSSTTCLTANLFTCSRQSASCNAGRTLSFYWFCLIFIFLASFALQNPFLYTFTLWSPSCPFKLVSLLAYSFAFISHLPYSFLFYFLFLFFIMSLLALCAFISHFNCARTRPQFFNFFFHFLNILIHISTFKRTWGRNPSWMPFRGRCCFEVFYKCQPVSANYNYRCCYKL